jgi:hypothetical protein
VQLTGFWLAADLHAQPVWQQQHGECRLPVALQQFLTDAKQTSKSQPLSQQQQGSGGAAECDPSRLSDSDGSLGDKRYKGLLLVDFGSMGCLGLLRNARLLLAVLLQALQLLNW